jgi:Protein of unknown function (DUF3606)
MPLPREPDDVAMKINNKKTSLNRAILDLKDKSETRHWTKEWGVTKIDLQRAVEKVGPAVHAVAKELGKRSDAAIMPERLLP